MIFSGEKIAEKIYRGYTHVLRIYKGFQLWYIYLVDNYLKTIEKIFSVSNAKVTKAVAGRVSVISKLFSGTQSKLNIDAVEKAKAEGEAFSGANAIGGTGHTEKIKADDISFSGADVTLTDHKGNIEAKEQQIISMLVVKGGKGYAQPHTAEEQHILFTQSVPTANKGQVIPQPVEQDFHIKDTASGGTSKARPQKAETHSLFSQSIPTLISQTILPVPQFVKLFTKTIGKMVNSKAKPQEAETHSLFSVTPASIDFGYVLPKAQEIEIHSVEIVSGGVGYAQPQTAAAESHFKNLVQLTDETTDVTAETGVYTGNVVLFDKGYGNGIKAENGGISRADSIMYMPKKQLETENTIKTDAFSRLFKIVCMSAETTAKLMAKPPLFRYVEIGASGGGVFANAVKVGDTTKISAETIGKLLHNATVSFSDKDVWHTQVDNVLYIYQSNSATQADNVLSVDTEAVEAWHTQTDNVLYINTVNTAQQTETQLEIDTAITEEWAVQAENTLYINRAIGTLQEETDVEIDIIENLNWAEQSGNVLTINQILTNEEIEVS